MTEQPNTNKTHIVSTCKRVSGPSGLKICCLNINSLTHHFDELNMFLDEEQPHIMALNEAKLDDTIGSAELSISNYHEIIRKVRTRYGGGVALYIHNSISYKCRNDIIVRETEALPADIKICNGRSISVVTWYRPEGPVEIFDHVETLISRIDSENKECIIIGDTNCNLLSEIPDNSTKHLTKLLQAYNFTQLIDEPTRTTADTETLIDHVITNRPDTNFEYGVITCGISDHDAVYVTRFIRQKTTKTKPRILKVRNFKRFDKEEFRRDLLDIPFSDVKATASDANKLWDIWKNFFLAVLNKHALPTTLRVKGRQLPYLTYEIKQLCRQRDYIKKRAIKTGSIYLWQAFRQLRNKVIYYLRNLRHDYYTRKIEENKGNLKNTWKILKHAIGKETKNVSIDKISKDGKIITDPIDIAECCNDHFASIGQRLAANVKNTVFIHSFW